MIFVRPTETFDLEYEYGGIYWEYETNNVYGVGATGSGTRRYVRKISDQSEELAQWLYFRAEVSDNREVVAAEFFSGLIGVLITRRFYSGGYWKMIPTIHWYDRGHTSVSSYNDLYNGAINFARVPQTGYTFIYQYSDADGTIARWDSRWGTEETPDKYHQMCPWRGQCGQARAFALQDFGAIEVPKKYLVTGSPTGVIRWADLEYWSAQQKILPIYKEIGVLGCKNLRDIALDRRENVLWILDGYSKLLKLQLEPFGIEEVDYENTPVVIKTASDQTEISPGDTCIVGATLYDMWGQRIEREDIDVDFIAGSGLGKLYDADSETYKTKISVATNADGVAVATYKADTISD